MQSAAQGLGRRDLFRRQRLKLEPGLLAEAVRSQLLSQPERAREYQRAAEELYRRSAEERCEGFISLDARYFELLGLGQKLREAVAPFGGILGSRVLLLLPSPSPAEEGADLASADGEAAVRLSLNPNRLSEPSLAAFCAHELAHVEDMLSPDFAYRPDRPFVGASRPERELARERYRLLWGASIDGRLLRRGLPSLLPKERWREQAEKAFPRARSEALRELLERLLGGEQVTHAALMELSARADLGSKGKSGAVPGQPCPLCHFTTYSWASPEELAQAQDSVAKDFPDWRPEDGACAQCLSCYQSSLSASEDIR